MIRFWAGKYRQHGDHGFNFVFIAPAWAVFSTISPMAISFNLYTIAIILQQSRCTTCGAIGFLLHPFGFWFVFFSFVFVIRFLVLVITCSSTTTSFLFRIKKKLRKNPFFYISFIIYLLFVSFRLFRPRTGFDKSSLERLEQLFRKTVGNEREIRREDFKKIVTSKNVRITFYLLLI